MSNSELIPVRLRRQHDVDIAKSKTFETHGLSKEVAVDYLRSPEGRLFRQRLIEADLNAPASKIDERAIEQLTSGRELPRMEIINEPLVKLPPIGTDVSPYSPYFARPSTVDDGLASGKSLHDYFGLPGKSEAARYRMDEVRPLAPTEVFISHVAPTSELGGQITRTGGAEQMLIPNRRLYSEPNYLRNIDNSLTLQAERRVGLAVKSMLGVAAVVGAGYDAYTTAEQYQSLSAQGNTFGADALLHRYEGRTAGGVLGGFGAGVAYGAAAGSESGPGALITGAVGGVIGAFAGDKIATLVNEHQVNHQTGTDGVTYAYENGQWGRTQHRMDPGSTGSANPYGAPSYASTTTPAQLKQLSQLDYQRTTAITALALANPSAQDTKNITLDRAEWHATQEGWAQSVEIPGVPNAYGIPTTFKVDKPADAPTREQLNQIAEGRQYNNAHYAEAVAQTYVKRRIRSIDKQATTGHTEERRTPMPPRELKALDNKEQLAFFEGGRPIQGGKRGYFNDRVFRKRVMPPSMIRAAHDGWSIFATM